MSGSGSVSTSTMLKAERVAGRVSELLCAALRDVLQVVRDALEESQRENEQLRRRVDELQEQLESRDRAVTLPTGSSGSENPQLFSLIFDKHPETHWPTLSVTEGEPPLKDVPLSVKQAAFSQSKIKTEMKVEELSSQNSFVFSSPSGSGPGPDFQPSFPATGTDFPPNTFTYKNEEEEEEEEEDDEVVLDWRMRQRQHSCQQFEEERHVCLLCGKTFSRLWNLRIHNRCHTGEKPYSCLHCGRRFSYSGNLQKHKRVHTGERPYRCLLCPKSFCQSSHLKKHQSVHTVTQRALTGRSNT